MEAKLIKKNSNFIKLSFIDFYFLAAEDVQTAAADIVTIRFKTKHSSEEIRNAMRYIISIYPRLRSVIEPTLFSYRLRILDDKGKRVKVLFNDSFRVRNNLLHDSDEFIEYRRELLNDSFSLGQELPIKIRFIPDDPMPVLLISVHHVICDGMAWLHMVNSLMAILNGKKPSLVPPESPSIIPATLGKLSLKTPRRIYRAFKNFKNDRKSTKQDNATIHGSSRPTDFFSPVDTYQHIISYDLPTILAKSRELNCSITVLLIAALSISIGKRSGKDNGNIVNTLLPVDLRSYCDGKQPEFCNYVAFLMINAHRKYWDIPKQLLKEINSQLTQGITKYKNKEMFFHLLIQQFNRIVGKKIFVRGMKQLISEDLLPITYNFSNLGNLERLNTHGTRAQVDEVIAVIPIRRLFLVTSSLNGRINTNFLYPEAEYTRTEIKELVLSFEHELGNLLNISTL